VKTPTSVRGLLVLRIGMSRRAGGRLFRYALVASCALAVALLVPAVAFGYWHHDPSLEPSGTREVRGTTVYACPDCHVTWTGGSDEGSATVRGAGPHGYYRTDTSKCRMCHSVHKAPAASIMLLPAATIRDTCFTCHDSTGAAGVYSAITYRAGSVGASHSIDATKRVPGGTEDLAANLSCTSCHAVHRATSIEVFRADTEVPIALGVKYSNALLRDDVGGKPRGTYTVYGADWCAGCHDRRHSDSTVVRNHPVEASTTAGFFNYGRVAAVTRLDETTTEIRADEVGGAGTGLGYTNFGYVMPWPRTTGVGGQYPHTPICQQCHEDTRDVGVVGATVPMVPGDQSIGTSNPVFYSFPHETVNKYMVIELKDDLCLNCHPQTSLP
jgi:predicted CXXCH cytochrome family protein